MIDSVIDFLGITGSVSSDVAFSIGLGFIFLVFCVLISCISSVFGRWFH